MFSRDFKIEDDLRRISRIRQEATSCKASGPFVVADTLEIDLSRLSNRAPPEKDVDRLRRLNLLSTDLSLIQELVSQDVEERLAKFRMDHRDSPIFSAATLFGPIDYGRLETATTRAIAWLADPSQPHGFGCEVAKIIFSLMGEEGKAQAETIQHVTFVAPEYRTNNGKRIDVWMEGTRKSERQDPSVAWTLFIEAKIDASESADQLSEYEEAIPENVDWYGIYLTPDGCDPKTSGKEKEWAAISFHQLARSLMSFYQRANSRSKPAAGTDFLRLFIAGILRDVLKRPPLPKDGRAYNSFDVAHLMASSLER